MSRPIRVAAAVGTVGLAAIGAGIAGMSTADAAAAPGSGFGNLSLSATAAGLRMPFYSSSGENVEGDVPEAQSSLLSGGVGHASSSVYWPGGTGAHGGDTIYLLVNGQCIPPNPPGGVVPIPLPCPTTVPNLPPGTYQAMNDPYTAEAQTGAGKPTSTTTGPGVKMTATATQTNVSSSTTMDGSAVPNVGNSVGATSAETTIKVTGPNIAKLTATSVMHDISLGGGVIKIASITSVATAVTNTKTGAGTAQTTVQGMTLAGTPVYIDNKGIHIASQHAGLPSMDAVNKALAQSGFAVFLAQPTKIVQGAAVDVNSGNVVVTQNNKGYTGNANDTGVILTLGGASIHADSSPGFAGYPVLPPPTTTGGHQPSTGGAAVPAGGTTGSTATTGGSLPPAPVVAGQQPPAQTPVLASQQSALPGGIKPVWVVLVLLGSVLVAAGLRRLPDEVLRSRGPACTLGSAGGGGPQ